MRQRLAITSSILTVGAATLLPGVASISHAGPAGPGPSETAHAVALADTVPSIVHGARRIGAMNPERVLHIAVPLALPNQAGLDQLVASQYDPTSANYHHFIDPATFGLDFGAPASGVAAATSALTSLGLTVAAPSSNNLYLDASGPVAALESAFNTTIANFRTPGGLSFFANTRNVTLPRQLAGTVTGVIGLDDTNRPEPQLTPASVPAQPAVGPVGRDGGATPCLAALGAGYTAPQLATAYDFNGLYAKGLLGHGMSAALVEFDDYHQSNVAKMEKCYGLHTPVQRRVIDGGTGGPPASGEIEDMADITTMLEMLPQLSHLYVYVAPITGLGEIDLYNRFATERVSRVLSSSWGNCEALNSQADNRLFAEIAEESAVQGQQILDAAGDAGAVDCSGYPAPTSQSVSVEEEAAVPWVTGIGGTDLGQKTADGVPGPREEDTWNSDFGAGGGGVSTLWQMPAWQHALKSARTAPGHSGALCGASSGELCREVPDLSADADTSLGLQGTKRQFGNDAGSFGYSIYCGTANCDSTDGGAAGWQALGGTSLATPLTAAAAVLWDEEAKSVDPNGFGLLNPSLYRIAANPKSYARDFHDITTDSNDAKYDTADCPPGCNPHHLYKAHKGYDMASGLGSYDAAKLGADLVTQSGRLTATPDHVTVYGYTHKGISTTSPIVISAGFHQASYTVHRNVPWLHVHLGTDRRLQWRANPKGLSPGTYHGRITVRSRGNGQRATIAVRYTVSNPATLQLSTKKLHFTEHALTSSGKPTSPTCQATLWNDELYNSVNDSHRATAGKATKRALRITNAGPKGSTLHWQAFAYSNVGGWLGVNLTRGQIATRRAPTIEPTGGADAPGRTSTLHLAATANANAFGGYPAMNQGTYHGVIKVYDLADPNIVKTVHATLRLGNGRHTPTIHGHLSTRTLSVATGHHKTVTLRLDNPSHQCGYAYSVSSNRSWVSPNANDYSGVVPAHGAGATGGSDTGDGKGRIRIRISALNVSPGIHPVTLTVQSQNAAHNPYRFHLKIHVTH